MKKLLAIYDSKLATKDTESFMKVISKGIKKVEFIDINNPNVDWKKYYQEWYQEHTEPLILTPFDKNKCINIEYLRELIYWDMDKGNPLVVDAILKTLGNITKKKIVIINQSQAFGVPLVTKLVEQKNHVYSISRVDNIENMLNEISNIDVLISATGNNKFKCSCNAEIIIDLSDDIESDNKITRVPIVQAIKERLNK